MKSMHVGNLPPETTEEDVRQLFSQFGTVRAIKLATEIFTGKCRGFGTVSMEGHEARAAIAALNGKTLAGKTLRVCFEAPRVRWRRRH